MRSVVRLLPIVLLGAVPAFAQYRPGLEERDSLGRVRMLTNENGQRFDFRYDADGSRRIRTGGREIAIERSDGSVEAFAYDDAGNKTQTRITRPGAEPQCIDHPVRVASAANPTASVQASSLPSGDVQPNGFAGEPHDPATGLNYHRARWYDPTPGRFISPDPEPGNPTVPDSFQPYTYASSDPVNGTDPTGRYTLTQLSVASGILSGLASSGITAHRGGSAREIVYDGLTVGITTTFAVYLGVPLIERGLFAVGAFGAFTTRELAVRIRGDVPLLQQFFGNSLAGARERLANFVIPQGLSVQTLQTYAEIARRAIAAGKDELGVQALRVQLCERAIQELSRK